MCRQWPHRPGHGREWAPKRLFRKAAQIKLDLQGTIVYIAFIQAETERTIQADCSPGAAGGLTIANHRRVKVPRAPGRVGDYVPQFS